MTAYVLLSGGQDSTTSLYWAKDHFDQVEAVTINYGQRHAIELGAARQIAEQADVPWVVYNFPILQQLSDSALLFKPGDTFTWALQPHNNLPASFLPGRNDFFLTIAAAHAYKHQRQGSLYLIAGVCQTDYSGYPDCRQEFIIAKERALSLALDRSVVIHAPLMYLTKAETVRMARSLPGCWAALAVSHTCYEGVPRGCGTCPACVLRAKGFAEAGERDPACLPQ